MALKVRNAHNLIYVDYDKNENRNKYNVCTVCFNEDYLFAVKRNKHI